MEPKTKKRAARPKLSPPHPSRALADVLRDVTTTLSDAKAVALRRSHGVSASTGEIRGKLVDLLVEVEAQAAWRASTAYKTDTETLAKAKRELEAALRELSIQQNLGLGVPEAVVS